MGCVPLAKYDFPPSGALLFQEKGELLEDRLPYTLANLEGHQKVD